MNRSRWQFLLIIVFAGLGGCALAVSILSMGTSPGPGEVSVILHGAFILAGLIFAAVCSGFIAWIWFWNIRWVRVLGLGVIGVALAFVAYEFGLSAWNNWIIKREIAVAEKEADAIGDRYLAQLIVDQRDTAERSLSLFRAYLSESGRVQTPSGYSAYGGREFRAIWFLHHWTFFDADFDGYATYYPTNEDCALFLDAFGARYAEIAPVPVFVDLCETP